MANRAEDDVGFIFWIIGVIVAIGTLWMIAEGMGWAEPPPVGLPQVFVKDRHGHTREYNAIPLETDNPRLKPGGELNPWEPSQEHDDWEDEFDDDE